MAKKDEAPKEEKAAAKKDEVKKAVETKYPFQVAKGKSLVHAGKVLSAGSEVKKEMFGRNKDGAYDEKAAEIRLNALVEKKIIVKN